MLQRGYMMLTAVPWAPGTDAINIIEVLGLDLGHGERVVTLAPMAQTSGLPGIFSTEVEW